MLKGVLMARRKKEPEARALYYPFIEVSDLAWLYSAALFWDEISTITPDVPEPYEHRASRTLADAGLLLPYRSTPNRREIVNISERIAGLIGNATFASVLGEDSWLVHQSRRYRVHPDKIESNLRHALERRGMAVYRGDGFLDMEGGLAAAYILLLAVEVAGSRGCSLVTDLPLAFQATDAARYQDTTAFVGAPWEDRRRRIGAEYVDACITEMMLTWFSVDPDTDPKNIVKFKRRRKTELQRFRDAMFRVNSNLLTESDLTYDDLRRRAREYVHKEVRPAYDDLKKTLREQRVKFTGGVLEAAGYYEIPGAAVAIAGQPWALIAAPFCAIAIRGVKYFLQRQSTLQNSPWSYLYRVEKKFGVLK